MKNNNNRPSSLSLSGVGPRTADVQVKMHTLEAS
jgi:endonuclease III